MEHAMLKLKGLAQGEVRTNKYAICIASDAETAMASSVSGSRLALIRTSAKPALLSLSPSAFVIGKAELCALRSRAGDVLVPGRIFGRGSDPTQG